MNVNKESEAKLGAWPGFRLPDLDGLAPWLRAADAGEQLLDAWYYDAPDLRLIRAGITVRHRSGEGGPDGRWTAKLPGGGDGTKLDRTEITVDGPPGPAPQEILGVLAGVLRRAELVPVARLQTRRRLRALRDGGGRPLGEVADDEVSVLEDGRVAARFREVEVEVASGAPSSLLPLVVGRLQEAGAGEADPTPKLVRALGPRALAPADPARPVLGDDASAGAVIQAAIAASVQRLLAHDPVIRLDGGEHGVHQARVSTRRLRSDLRTFEPLLDEEWAESLRAELKVLADALGRVRDLDVLETRLLAAAAQLGRADEAEAVRLARRLRREREYRRKGLLEVLTSDGYFDLLDRLVASARAPRLNGAAKGSAKKVLPGLVATPWKKLAKAAGKLGQDASDEELHELRIKAKRARYATEAVARVVTAADEHADAIAAVQSVLGDQHDAVVAEQWLRQAVRAGVSRQQALVAGLLIAAERVDAARQRHAWREAWAKANKKKVRAWIEG